MISVDKEFTMEDLLKTLLNRLEGVGKTNEELYDTECRERLSGAVFDGFIKPVEGFDVPNGFGLYSPDANMKVRGAIGAYIADAKTRAAKMGLRSFHDRLAAFQNQNVRSDGE